ncbi:MAG: helix-turn-helix transcriptional regulator [Egibacteraceae bacterium]
MVLLADLMLAHLYLADTAGAVRLAATVEDVLPRTKSTGTRARGEVVVGVAHVLAGEPGIDRIRIAVRYISEAPKRAKDPRHPDWDVLGTQFLRESGTGRELMEQTVQELREGGALAMLPTALLYAARDDATTDRWHDGVARYEEGVALARETGDTTALVLCLAGLSLLQARMGRDDDCTASADEAMRVGAERRLHLGRIWAMFARGDLALARGEAAAAVECFEGLAAELASIGVGDVDLSPGPELAEALVRVGRTEEAAVIARAHAEQAHAKGQPWAMARAERALALISDGDDVAAHFKAALTHHASTLDVYEDARTRLAYGAAMRRRRQRVAARPHLRAALEMFEALGAEPWARTAAGELDATGETPQRRGAGRTTVLTAQELQIARLLAGGKTTRETAAAMFLSPKTVEYHLRHAYTKLGINSRSELATALGD